MGERLIDVGPHLAIYKVHIDECREQDINAQVMSPEMFDRLRDNIKKENRLEQLPFAVAREGGKYFEMISGHHRLRAARAAGITEVFLLVDERDLSQSQVRAKQIAHNRLSGTSDLQTLKTLFEQIDSVDDVLESYLTPDAFDDIRQLDPAAVSDLSVTLPYRYVGLVFLPQAIENVDELTKFVKRMPKGDEQWLLSNDAFEEFRKVALTLSRKEDVRSMGAVLSRMLEIVRAHLEQEGLDVDEEQAAAPPVIPAEVAKAARGRRKVAAKV